LYRLCLRHIFTSVSPSGVVAYLYNYLPFLSTAVGRRLHQVMPGRACPGAEFYFSLINLYKILRISLANIYIFYVYFYEVLLSLVR
jgi:hypothetical protein